MIEEIIKPTLEIGKNIIEEAKKIVEEKKPEEYTEEDLFIIDIAFKLIQLGKEKIKWSKK